MRWCKWNKNREKIKWNKNRENMFAREKKEWVDEGDCKRKRNTDREKELGKSLCFYVLKERERDR